MTDVTSGPERPVESWLETLTVERLQAVVEWVERRMAGQGDGLPEYSGEADGLPELPGERDGLP
jgi:hypothetical protein